MCGKATLHIIMGIHISKVRCVRVFKKNMYQINEFTCSAILPPSTEDLPRSVIITAQYEDLFSKPELLPNTLDMVM